MGVIYVIINDVNSPRCIYYTYNIHGNDLRTFHLKVKPYPIIINFNEKYVKPSHVYKYHELYIKEGYTS